MKILVNEDTEQVTEIRARVKENQGHCACSLPWTWNKDNMCMCKEFRDQIARGEPGWCHCHLYKAEK